MAKKENFCRDCGKSVSRYAKRCKRCASRVRWKIPKFKDAMLAGLEQARLRGDLIAAQNRPEVKAKKRRGTKARWDRGEFTSEILQKIAEGNRQAHKRGCYANQPAAISAAWKRGVYDGIFTEEVRAKLSKVMDEKWANGTFDGSTFSSPSSLEAAIAAVLDECGIEYIQQHRLDGAQYRYDFFIPPALLVEVDGEYWHSLPGRAERDQQKTDLATGQGFTLLRVPEQEFRNLGPVGVVEKRILPALGQTDSLLEPSFQ